MSISPHTALLRCGQRDRHEEGQDGPERPTRGLVRVLREQGAPEGSGCMDAERVWGEGRDHTIFCRPGSSGEVPLGAVAGRRGVWVENQQVVGATVWAAQW